MDTYSRHHLGQNFLTDPKMIAAVQGLVGTQTSGPIVELCAGDGALTRPLSRLDRPLTALEIDPRRARRLAAHLRSGGAPVDVVCTDMLRYQLPDTPHVIVGNIPFHLTTALIRRLFQQRAWTCAVLIVQWEVARRRAGVGGASMLTASWWPWYEFRLVRRVPATSFRPVPSVDAGLMTMHRRPIALVAERRAYQTFVAEVFQSRGCGVAEMVLRTGRVRKYDLHNWLRLNEVPARALPKDLNAQQWADLWRLALPSRHVSGRGGSR